MEKNEIKSAYMAMKVSNFHRRNKLRAIEYKGGKCQLCGYDKSPTALIFHHRNPSEKDFGISSKVWKWERIKPELDKCDLLCNNCHSEEHERLFEVGRHELYEKIRMVIPERLPAEFIDTQCSTCGKAVRRRKSDIRYGKAFCSHGCVSKKQERIKWPNEKELQLLVSLKPVSSIAKELGVSGASVKNHCEKHGIKTPGPGYWSNRIKKKRNELGNFV